MSNTTQVNDAQFFVDVIGQPSIIVACLFLTGFTILLQILKKQPIKQKMFIHLLLIGRILTCVFQLIPSLPTLSFLRCYFYPFGVLPINFTLVFIYFIVSMQVLATKRVQDMKLSLHELTMGKQDTFIVPKTLKLLQIFSSRIVAFIIYAVFICALYGIHILLFFVVARQNCFAFSQAVRFTVVAVYLILCALIAILLLVDLWESREDCFSFRCWRPYTADDPLAYRRELTSIVLVVIGLMALTFVVTVILRASPDLAIAVLKIVADVLSLMIIPGISIIATLWQECKVFRLEKVRRSSRNSLQVFNPSEETIRMLLADPAIASIFKSFAKKEFSIENVLFFEEVQHFRKNPTYALCKRIWSLFLDGSAVLEVNVTEISKKDIITAMKNYEEQQTPIPPSVFSACETIVIANLQDTYRRFFTSSQFSEILESKV